MLRLASISSLLVLIANALAINATTLIATMTPPAIAADARCFPQTGQCISGRFREVWEQSGGIAIFGLPITAAQSERSPDTGKTYLMQWFERARFELHPANPRPYDVLLGRLGDESLRKQGIIWQQAPREAAPPSDDSACLWFRETGRTLCDQPYGPPFKTFWQRHGQHDQLHTGATASLALFGFPLTEPRWMTNSSGYFVLAQWFERARLEWHPDRPLQPTRYTVQVGRLGYELAMPPEAIAPGDLQRAHTTLLSFFTALHEGNYAQAAQYYGGSYDILRTWNPDTAPDDYAGLLAGGCEANGLQCLKIKKIVREQATAAREFRFLVEFANEDGTTFRRGPCCGASEEEMPPETQFGYIVTKIGDQFLVQGLPVYVP
ncbi:hypothetical protein [Kallotenue papyrolyticum]|uniref:hypothetical protein n=1 Tax=Kallotenue papyrolyticum TaxID=1325125 RepID=UPI00047866B8|nr:hypothetical protein [Kallotenue papyrolyticum]